MAFGSPVANALDDRLERLAESDFPPGSGDTVVASSGVLGGGLRTYAFVIGCCLFALGVVGLRYAPAIVRAQAREGMTPVADGEIDDADRIRVTKGTSVGFLVGGALLVAYAVGLA